MSEAVELRVMQPEDIPAADRLRAIAGWNQTEVDWRRMLELEPRGCFVACRGGRVCGTATALRHGGAVGWVGMVLMDPADRRQGIGTRLLDRGIAYLDEAGVETAKLDATPMGRPLYLQRGFVDEYGIERWEGSAPAGARRELDELDDAGLERVLARDPEVFGADRGRLLRAIRRSNPRYGAALYRSGELAGYMLGRTGARAQYLGPWVARDRAAAEALLREFLARAGGEPVYVDVCLRSPFAGELVRDAGFRLQRPLTRMFRGPRPHAGAPELVCGIAGPEIG